MKHKLATVLLAFSVSLPVFSGNETFLFSPKGIAEVHITLDDGKSIDDIKRDEKINDNEYVKAVKLKAQMVIKNTALSTYGETELYNGKIEIKGRGNTTWGVPKRPYSIDLIDVNGEDNPQSLLGMPADEEWALLAFWHDRSWMRIPLAFYLGSQMQGLAYTPRLRYVEVYINGDYRGMYCLSEKIKRSKNRVNISKLSDDTPSQLSGGYILEVSPDDKIRDKQEKDTQIETENRHVKLVFNYPKPKNVTLAQRTWIKDYLTEFENALYGSNFKDPVNGYQKYIDEDSFIDWYILHDLSKGVDNLFHASIYLHKDRNGKLNMSVPWDFDISFGNVNSDCYYEDELWIAKTQYFNQLLKDDRFARKLIDRYDALMQLFDKIPEIMETNLQQLEVSGAIERDRSKWPQILGDYQDKEGRRTPTTVRGHVRWLREWLESRRTWLYLNLSGLTDEERCTRLKNSKPIIRIMNPEGFENGASSDTKLMKGYTYVWNNTDVKESETFRISSNKTYWAQLRDEHGCTSLPSKSVTRGEKDDVPQSIVSSPTLDTKFWCSNWVKGSLSIDYSTDKVSVMNLVLYNVSGVQVKQIKINLEEGENNLRIDLSEIAGGLYLLKCDIGTDIFTKKIFVLN